MPPLKGRGGPPLGGGEVRPRRQRGGVASVYSSEILNVFPKLSAIL